MKIIRRILLTFSIFIILIGLLVVIFYRKEAVRLYYATTMFSPNKISENFRTLIDKFDYSTVSKPAVSSPFPVSETSFTLPQYFSFQDSTINTQAFLDFTLTDALLIIQNDTLIYEKYGNGFEQFDHHISWSVSKSVLSALVGIAVERKQIKSIEETVTDYVPELIGTAYEGVRIKDVLQMSTGVGFNEDYSDFYSDINRMGRYFALGMPMDDFAATLKRVREPGTYNHYVSVNTHVLGMVLRKATGQTVTRYMEENLWTPIGAESDAYWIIDYEEVEFVLGGLNATARDYAKVGQLYLDSGRWQGKQLVPESWVLNSVTPDAPHLMAGSPNSDRSSGYGYHWWIPENADDEFQAQGIYNQFIYVDPDKNMVIVKLSSNHHFKNEKVSSVRISDDFFRAIAGSL